MALNFALPRRFMEFLALKFKPTQIESVFFRKSRSYVKFKPIKLASDLIRIGAIHKLGTRS